MKNDFASSAPFPPPRISLIVASADSAESDAHFLRALAEQGPMPDVEILIVDGRGDTPPDKNEPVRRLQVPRQPLPFLWARGIAEAKGEWLVIMETTCPPAPGWLPALPRRTACAPGVFGGAGEIAEGHGVVDWAA